MAYINVTSITTNSITAQVAGLETSYNGYIRNCTWSLNGAVKGTTTIPNGVSAGGTFTFRQLTGGTTYLIHVSIMAQGWSQSVELDMAATTGGSAISLWSWESSNGSASTLLTKNAYQAITGKGLVVAVLSLTVQMASTGQKKRHLAISEIGVTLPMVAGSSWPSVTPQMSPCIARMA